MKGIGSFIKKNKKFLLEILGIFFIVILYEIIALIINDNLIFPDLSHLFSALFESLRNVSTYSAFGYSFLRTFVSLIASFLLAFILGSIAGYFKGFRYFISPLINLMKLVPTPCVVYIIFLFFFKDLEIGSFIVTFIVIFPIMYESFIAGHDNLSESIQMSLRLEGYYKPKSFFKVILPETFPFLLLGATNSIALGIKVSIMSEILLNSSSLWGIGRLIYVYRNNSDYASMFAIVILVIIVFIIIDLILYPIKRKLQK